MSTSEARAPYTIDATARINSVSLVVANLDRSISFYSGALGLHKSREGWKSAGLGAGGEEPILWLYEGEGITPRPPRTLGLYHFALLVPTRRDLARSLRRLVESGNRLQGAADHIVSEALYISDPDGNGVEIYRDRPSGGWDWSTGEVRMDTLPISFNELLQELDADGEPWTGIAPGTRMGHVHLHVPDLREATRFYVDVLGFRIVSRLAGAVFVSAGNYHHHVGLNTWAARNAAPADAAGMERFEIQLPSALALSSMAERIANTYEGLDEQYEGFQTRDPFGNRIIFTSER